jgi:hypothetical protein
VVGIRFALVVDGELAVAEDYSADEYPDEREGDSQNSLNER